MTPIMGNPEKTTRYCLKDLSKNLKIKIKKLIFQLLHKASMIQLNKARLNLKHQGQLINKSDKSSKIKKRVETDKYIYCGAKRSFS